MTLACGDSQIIKTKPMPGEDEAISWKTTTLESILTNVQLQLPEGTKTD